MRKPKISNPIPEANPKVEIIQFYSDLEITMEHPHTIKTFDRIGKNWVLDAKINKDTLHPSEYTSRCGMSWDTVKQFLKNNEAFRKYYDEVRQVLGVKRERKMVEASPNTIMNSLPQYLEEYVVESERRSKLKASEGEKDNRPVEVFLVDRSGKLSKDKDEQ